MKIHDFFVPPGVIYGPGALARLPDEAGGLGQKALLVSGKGSLARAGSLAGIEKALRGRGIAVVAFDGVESDPSIQTVDRGAREAVKAGCDIVVAAGGGSVIDAGKAMAGMATNPGSVREYLEGRGISKRPLPFIAIPTTAGTGAEVTKNAVLTNREEGYKRSIRHRWLIPAVALVDPELTLTVPPEITASTGMDTLAQLIEPLVSRKGTPITDALAIHGIGLVRRSLRNAVRDGTDMRSRTDMSLASLLSGMALANSGLGAAHALSHPLGAHLGIPHGCGCAILLPHVMEFNIAAAAEKYASIARALGEDVHGLSQQRAAEQAVEFVKHLSRDIGIPACLSGLGVGENDLPMLARESHGSSLSGNPVEASDGDLVEILRKAL